MARENLFIKVGTYTGDGNDDRIITGIGFQPQLVIVKGGVNVACIRTEQMRGDSSISMSSAVATAVNQIQGFTTDGFVVGTSVLVNESATVYYYIAIRGTAAQNYFRTGNYRGNGANNRDFTTGGIGFTPDLVGIFGDTTELKVWKSSSVAGDLAQYFSATVGAADKIQNLQSNGFQLGTGAEVNGNTVEYFFFAMRAFSEAIAVGTYTGNGADNVSITGVGFQPDAVIVKKTGATARSARMKTSDQTGENTLILDATAASASNNIQAFESDGFQIGTDNAINASSAVYYWIAFKEGNFNAPIVRTAV